MARLRIGSRGSQLALWQAQHVAGLLRERAHEVSIEVIQTTGDRMVEVAFAQVGAKGMFTKEIEEALQAGKIDLAVHSLKDLPTDLPPQFELAAILLRADARDAFVSKHFASLKELPAQAHVGTSSLRREAQLRAVRKDLRISTLRGNVDTRLRKLDEGQYDAILLALAGLQRIGREQSVREVLDIEIMCPAAGQGALAIEIRGGDLAVRQLINFLNDPATYAATSCERSLLRALGGGCQVPIGAYATLRQSKLHLLAKVGKPDGSLMLTEDASGDDADALGRQVAEKLLQRGAAQLLGDLQQIKVPLPEHP